MESNQAVRDYIDCFISNNFLQSLLLLTRVSRSSSTIIDHICFFNKTQDKRSKAYCGHIVCDISDHDPNYFMIKLHKYLDMSIRPYIRIFSNKMLFSESLKLLDWG